MRDKGPTPEGVQTFVAIDGKKLPTCTSYPFKSDSTVFQRAFWLDSVRRYGKRTYIVFEDQSVTYEETHMQAVRLATALKRAYGVSKGEEDHSSCFLTLTIFKEIASP